MTVDDYVGYCMCIIATGFALLVAGGVIAGLIGLFATLWGTL